jgi:hypothetical protein
MPYGMAGNKPVKVLAWSAIDGLYENIKSGSE